MKVPLGECFWPVLEKKKKKWSRNFSFIGTFWIHFYRKHAVFFFFFFFSSTLIDPYTPKRLLKQARSLSCTSPFSFSTAKTSSIISPWQRQVTLWELVSYVTDNKLYFKDKHYLCRDCSYIQILKELFRGIASDWQYRLKWLGNKFPPISLRLHCVMREI